jgi:isoleucyl-tRNA synthetase
MDYKSTLNLPKTDFPMKANLPQREPEMLARWAQERLYERIQQSRQGREQYILHDGPPYANGRIHIGHALNKILKDIIVKSKTMSGYQVPYVPGRTSSSCRAASTASLRPTCLGGIATACRSSIRC